MKLAWQQLPNMWDATMLWAAATMCFFGFLRSGEVVVPRDNTFDPNVHLVKGDVKVKTPGFWRWSLRHRKQTLTATGSRST